MTLYGAGVHYDPLISSRAKSVVSLGHDWVVPCLIIVKPFWSPTKVFALPIAVRLYRNRQGLTKGNKGRRKVSKPNPDHRTRPQLAIELIQMVARWFTDDEIVLTGDSAYGGNSTLSDLPPNVHLISHVHPKGALYERAPVKKEGSKGAPRTKGARLLGIAPWAKDPAQPWARLKFNRFGLRSTLAVKTIRALYYKAGGDRVVTIVLVHDLEGKRPDQMFYCTKLNWSARQILTAYSYHWAIE